MTDSPPPPDPRDPTFCGQAMADALQRTYERQRQAYRALHGLVPKEKCE